MLIKNLRINGYNIIDGYICGEIVIIKTRRISDLKLCWFLGRNYGGSVMRMLQETIDRNKPISGAQMREILGDDDINIVP